MHSKDSASHVGMVIFLLIAAILYVREEAWAEHAARAKATVIENTNWFGGRLWNRSPMTLTDVEFHHAERLIESKMRSWTHRHTVGEVVEVVYDPADTSWVYPSPTPLFERPSIIMASVGGCLGILAIIEFLGRKHRARMRDYFTTCGEAEREAWTLTDSIDGRSADQSSVETMPLIEEQTATRAAEPTTFSD